MNDGTYGCRPTTDCRHPSIELLRQTGAAIAAAEAVVPWRDREFQRRPRTDICEAAVLCCLTAEYAAEGVSIRTGSSVTIDHEALAGMFGRQDATAFSFYVRARRKSA
jgi:hypothetical protein